MPEVKTCIATIVLPNAREPTGQIAYGHYVEGDGVVTMTNRDGRPVEDGEGRQYVHELGPGEDADTIARRLTVKIRLALRGGGGPWGGGGAPVNGFEKGPLDYSHKPVWKKV